MSSKPKCSNLPLYCLGIALISLSIWLIIEQPQMAYIASLAYDQFKLLEGRAGYERIWSNLDLYFRIYVFDVLNPGDVVAGSTPQFKERGPYVYDMNIKREVLSVNETSDEINFMTVRTYHFNKNLSNGKEDDMVTVINSAYMGTIGMMASSYPSFLKKLGNELPKLYPGMESIFLHVKVGDLLFHGLPMECDGTKYKQLKVVCGFLMGKKPPVIEDTDIPNVYKWSLFKRLNGTAQGPLTVNRGVKNKTLLGDTTSFKGKRIQKLWKSAECNRVQGTDSITWAPMDDELEYVYTFETQICRWVKTAFNREVVIADLVGRRYEMDEHAWADDEVTCYCPVVKKKPICPPTGLMDLTPCQEAPIFYSEPHFLHGDPSLLEYAAGLRPNRTLHATFITIEPLSGIPLSGSKKLQLNAKLIKSPDVEFLANVTEGYFPILWVEEAKDATVDSVAEILQAYRLRRLLTYALYVPLVIGIFVIMRTIYLQSYTVYHRKSGEFETLDSVFVRRRNPPIERRSEITRRPRARFNQG